MKLLGITLFVSLTIYAESKKSRGPARDMCLSKRGTDKRMFYKICTWPNPKKNWTDAKTWCESHKNGTLAILDSSEKQRLVWGLVNGCNGHFWVGLQFRNGSLEWVNGITANLNRNLYGDPLSGSGSNKCYYVKKNQEHFFKKSCEGKTRGMICEVRNSTASHSDIHSTPPQFQTTQQASATTDALSPETSSLSTIPQVYMTTPAATSTIPSSSPMNDIGTSSIQAIHTSSSSSSRRGTTSRIYSLQTSKTTPAILSSSSVDNVGTSSIQASHTSSSSSSRRGTTLSLYSMQTSKTTQATSSSSIVYNKGTSSIQPSLTLASLPSSDVGSTSDIKPTLTSSVQASTTAMSTKSSSKESDMINHFHNVMKNLNTSNPDCMSVLLKEYDDLMNWIDDKEEDMEYNPLTDAKSIENIALEFTKQHLTSNRSRNLRISQKEIAFHARLVEADIDSDVIFPEAGKDPDVNTISLPKSLFKGQETYIVNVVYKNNKTIRQLTPTVMEGQDDKPTWSVNTGIFSTAIFPKKKEPFEDVNITLHHIQKMKYAKPHCSFWNFSIPTSYNGSWSQQGCRVVSATDTRTVCACNHLTNFAVLMKLNSHEVPPEHKTALLIITYAGLALSLLGEAITVILYCVFLNLRLEKTQIRVNLLCSLAAAQVIFLAGIDKTDNKNVCLFIASLIHLLYLVCFCWMLMEGVYLYRMVVKVFDAHVTLRYSYIFSFGFPLCVVAVSLITASAQNEGIYSYLSSEYCWIRFHNGFIWSFIAPVLMLIAINCFFLFSVLKEMALMKSVKTVNSFELSSFRASARACAVLLPLLGITWLFGLLSVISTTGVAWQYIFTILNTMQGFMIFVFHCLRNTELRAAMELRYFQWESTHSNKHHPRKSSTPSKFLTFDESEKSRTNSLPMTTKINQVTPTSA